MGSDRSKPAAIDSEVPATFTKDDIGSHKCETEHTKKKIGAILSGGIHEKGPLGLLGEWKYKNHCTASRVRFSFKVLKPSEKGDETDTETEYLLSAAHCFKEFEMDKPNPDGRFPKSVDHAGFKLVFCEEWAHSDKFYSKEVVETAGCLPIQEFWTPHLWSPERLLSSIKVDVPSHYSQPKPKVWKLIKARLFSYDYALVKVGTKRPGFHLGISDKHTYDLNIETLDCSIYGYPSHLTLTRYEVLGLHADQFQNWAHDETRVVVHRGCPVGGTSGGPVTCEGSEDGVERLYGVYQGSLRDDYGYMSMLNGPKVVQMIRAIDGTIVDTPYLMDHHNSGHDWTEKELNAFGIHTIAVSLKDTGSAVDTGSDEKSMDVHVFDVNSETQFMKGLMIGSSAMIILLAVFCIGLSCGLVLVWGYTQKRDKDMNEKS
eukprot:798794_1